MTNSLTNGLGRTAFPLRPGSMRPGYPSSDKLEQARPYPHPLRRQTFRIAFGGTASNGDYVTTITKPDGSTFSVTTTRTGGSPSTNANLATQHAADWADAIASGDAKGWIVSAEVASSTNVDIAVKHFGVDLAVPECTAPGSGTLAATETVDPAKTAIPVGRFLVLDTIEGVTAVRLPSSGDSAVNGVSVVSHMSISRPREPSSTDEPSYYSGDTLTLATRGTIPMLNVGGDASANGAVYAVVNTAGGDALGAARGTDDGSNSVAVTGARWLAATAEGEVGEVWINF